MLMKKCAYDPPPCPPPLSSKYCCIIGILRILHTLTRKKSSFIASLKCVTCAKSPIGKGGGGERYPFIVCCT